MDVYFQTKQVTIKESFLGYIEIHSKDAASLEKVIVKRLKSDAISLAHCRAQCYDNAAVMAGIFLAFNNEYVAEITEHCLSTVTTTA